MRHPSSHQAPGRGLFNSLLRVDIQAKSWSRPRRVVARIEWHRGELFPRIGFVVTNSRLTAGKVVKVYNGRAEIENRIKEGKNTLQWDKTSASASRLTRPGCRWGSWPIISCMWYASSMVGGKN
uniref:Transposase DDE domain-containing protein n=1 Tax=Desulfobacca acetoxidans TaxID=60893 RepID=A0A7C3SI59_9BACT